MEAVLKLSPETLQRCRNRERCAKPCREKGDARRYPVHTLAPNPQQDELELELPDARNI